MEGLGWRAAWYRHDILLVHPKHLIGPIERVLLDFWQALRPDAMGALGHLPFAGGYGDQPAALMRCLDAMVHAQARIREHGRKGPGHG